MNELNWHYLEGYSLESNPIICLIQRLLLDVYGLLFGSEVCVCVCVRESLGHAAILHYFGSSSCAFVCVRFPLSLPQTMTLSAACPRSASAEAAGTVR